jgi:hypothetical protein
VCILHKRQREGGTMQSLGGGGFIRNGIQVP